MSEIKAIQKYMESDLIRSRFADVLGDRNAAAYINSVLLAVANSEDLQKCSLPSIYTSALRAATLRLSVDPGLGQAHLVPYKNIATLIVGYKGLVDMSTRTGQYRYINVTEIYEGEEVIEDRMSGWHSLSGGKKSSKIIGWLAAFEMINRFAKTKYMTIEQIHEHAKMYSPSYDNPKGMWTKKPRRMERKTVLRLLLREWGYMDPNDSAILDEIESEHVVINGEFAEEEPTAPETPKSEVEQLNKLGYPPEPSDAPEATVTRSGSLAERLVEAKIFDNIYSAEKIIKSLKLLEVERDAGEEWAFKQARGYRGWCDMGSFTSEQAIAKIKLGEFPA